MFTEQPWRRCFSAAVVACPRPPHLPPPLLPPPPPALARVPGARRLSATWGRASAASAPLPVQRLQGRRRRCLRLRLPRRGDREPSRLKGCVLCRCAEPSPAPPWLQYSWRTTSWSRLEAAAEAAVAPRQPQLLLLPEPLWRQPPRLRPALATD